MVKMTEQMGEKLKLTEQSTLQAIQLVNILDQYHHQAIAKILHKQSQMIDTLVMALLSLCSQIFELQPPAIKYMARIVHCKYLNFELKEQI